MADLVVTPDGIGYKRRNPWGVFLLGLVTFGVYFFVWWYKINNELRNNGQQNDPTVALLAVLLGWVIIVPPFVSYYRTAERILHAQEATGASERIIPVLALVLWVVVSPFAAVYYQSQLNKAWDALAQAGAEVRPA
jgi:drug/metabolite transporter (DMT)-like permease